MSKEVIIEFMKINALNRLPTCVRSLGFLKSQETAEQSKNQVFKKH